MCLNISTVSLSILKLHETIIIYGVTFSETADDGRIGPLKTLLCKIEILHFAYITYVLSKSTRDV